MATKSEAELLAKLAGKGGKKKAKGLPKRTGKRKAKFLRYQSRRRLNKMFKVVKHNGLKAAAEYAETFDCLKDMKKVVAGLSARRRAILDGSELSGRRLRRLPLQKVMT